MVRVWKRWIVWMKIFIVVLIIGFVCLSNTWAAGHVMATRITAFFYLFWYFSNVTVYDINVYFYMQDTIWREKPFRFMFYLQTQPDVIYSIFPNTSLSDAFIWEIKKLTVTLSVILGFFPDLCIK